MNPATDGPPSPSADRIAIIGLWGRCWVPQLRGFTRSQQTPRGRSLTLGNVRLPARPFASFSLAQSLLTESAATPNSNIPGPAV